MGTLDQAILFPLYYPQSQLYRYNRKRTNTFSHINVKLFTLDLCVNTLLLLNISIQLWVWVKKDSKGPHFYGLPVKFVSVNPDAA